MKKMRKTEKQKAARRRESERTTALRERLDGLGYQLKRTERETMAGWLIAPKGKVLRAFNLDGVQAHADRLEDGHLKAKCVRGFPIYPPAGVSEGDCPCCECPYDAAMAEGICGAQCLECGATIHAVNGRYECERCNVTFVLNKEAE